MGLPSLHYPIQKQIIQRSKDSSPTIDLTVLVPVGLTDDHFYDVGQKPQGSLSL